jgi:enoyl-CoA hydratase/carnithine racemase
MRNVFQCPSVYKQMITGRKSFSTRVVTRDLVKWEKTEALKNGKSVAVVSFNRPKQLNALDSALAKEFREIIGNNIAKDDSIGALVLTGEGDKAFSAGGDYEFLLERCRDQPYNNTQQMLKFYESFLTPLLVRLQVPTVAAINGFAIGAGLCVAMACDIRVTCPEAKMGVTFSQLGLHPGMGSTHFLPYLLNHQIASYLLLTGDVVDGNKAKELGMVLEVVPKDNVRSKAIEIAEKMAQHPQLAVKTCLKSLRVQQLEMLDRHLMREADAQAQCYATDELRQIVLKMKEKQSK